MIAKAEYVGGPKNMKNFVINLNEYGATKIYTGRDNGTRAREHFHLEEIEEYLNEEDLKVTIEVPATASTLNSSFLLGFLDKTIQKTGSKESFLKHFTFRMNEKFNSQLDETIHRALLYKEQRHPSLLQ
jgi:hypothetical protein